MPSPQFAPATWNTDVAVLAPTKRHAKVRQRWVNFLSDGGEWRKIDCNFKETAAGWEVTDAPFIFRAPKKANEEAYFESNCRYDIFEKQEITDAPFWMKLKASSAAPVSGEVFDMNGNGLADSIIYRNAYPEWGADLIYYVEHGRAPRLRKLVRFTTKPVVDPSVKTLSIPFDVSFSEDPDITIDEDKPLSAAKKAAIELLETQLVSKRQDKSLKGFLDENAIARAINDAKRTRWAKKAKMVTKRGISHRPAAGNVKRGIGFKDFFVWDSNMIEQQSPEGTISRYASFKKQRIDVEYAKGKAGWLTITKLVPVSFFPDSVFPVYTDLSGTFYPNPNTESTSVDGILHASGDTFSNLRGASTCTSADDSSATLSCKIGFSGGEGIDRAPLLFDTSSLGASAAPTAGTVSTTSNAGRYKGSNDNTNYELVLCAPASNTALTTSDWVTATKWTMTAQATALAIGSGPSGNFSAGNVNVWTLNATGIGNISITGITKFAIVTDSDKNNSGFVSSDKNEVYWYTADQALTTLDPVLDVTYDIAPDPPTGLGATSADGSTTINLSWTDNSSDEDGFKIERSNDGSTGWSQIDTVGAGVTTYADALGANSTLKYYRVRAYRGSVNSAYTGVASAKTAPAAPSGLAAAPVSGTPTSMALSWTDNSSDETSFSIERSANGSTGWTEVLTPAAAATTATDTGLSADTTYYYRIRAIRSGDGYDSNYSSNANGQTGPATPTGEAAVGLDATTTIRVTWTDVATSETSYEVERSDDGSTGWSNISGSLSAGVVTYDDEVGAASTTKFYRIRAVRSGVNSGYSGVAEGETAPAGPLSLVAVPVTGTYNIALTWSDEASDEDEYSIERSNNGSTGWTEIGTAAADAETYTDTSVGAGDTTRHYRVRAQRNDGADSEYSNSTSAVTAPQAPTNLAGTVSNLLVTLTWDDNATTETGFVLERKYESEAYSTINSPAANVETYEDPTELDVNHTYTYRLKATRSSDSMNSPTTTVVVEIPPEEPTNLAAACTVAAVSASQVLLTWDVNSTEETGFLIERSLNDSDWSTVTTTDPGANTYEDTGLEKNTTYYYRVSAVGSLTNSDPTASVSVLTVKNSAANLLLAFKKKTRSFPF